MRLFTAIEVGELIHTRSATLIGELRRRAAAAHGATLTWVDPARVHLTVRFVGEVTAEVAERIREALARPISVVPFELACSGLVAFPNARRARVIACGISRGREEASHVEAVVSDRLERLDIPRESRMYRPHITLARVREIGALRTERLFDELEDVELGSTHVEAITLFESRLSSKGPTYTPLMRTPLAA